jgi:flagellin
MNTMLNSIRSLAVHSSNTGANDSQQVLADQTAVDKAIESIQRIATTTKFAGKYLLDGSSGTTITDAAGTTLTNSTVDKIGASGVVTITILTTAAQGDTVISLAGTGAAFSAALGADASITVWADVAGVAMTSRTYIPSNGETFVSFAARVNADSTTTGVRISNIVAGTNAVDFLSDQYGANAKVNIVYGSGFTGVTSGNATVSGVDVAASIAGVQLDGSGLVLYGSAGSVWGGTTLTLTSGAATVATTYLASINVGDLKFSLTDNASTADLITYGIRNMQTNSIGSSLLYGNNGLDQIKSGQLYSLSSDPQASVSIIDQAIADVSMARAKLGAFQKYTLETTLNNLGVTRENLAASESRIRDVDMAKEMMDFTKNQILVQAGTAMLAQANQLPQTVLKLLG